MSEGGVDSPQVDLWAWGHEACRHMDGWIRDPDRVSGVVIEALTRT